MMVCSDYISRQAAEDLGIFSIAPYFMPHVTADEVVERINRYVLYDGESIRQRSECIMALLRLPDVQKVLDEQVTQMRIAQQIANDGWGQESSYMTCTKQIRILRCFVGSLRSFDGIRGCDPTVDELIQPMIDILDSEAFRLVCRQLENAESSYIKLNDITLGVNITSSGSATKLFLMDVNKYKNQNPKSILDKPSDDNITLFRTLPVKNKNEAVYIESHILSHIDKLWRKNISQTMKHLKTMPNDMIKTWLEWGEKLEPVMAGVNFSKAFENKGCPLCIPEVSSNDICSKSLYSPDMVLRSAALPVPYNIEPESAMICFITGTNHSGKTVFLRSLAQCMIFAQLGFPIPAKDFRFSTVRKVLTLFSKGEVNDVSRFEQEAEEMHRILRDSNENTVLFINEPYTSTNPIEALPMLLDAFDSLYKRHTRQFIVTHLYDLYVPLNKKYGEDTASYVTKSVLCNGEVRYFYEIEKRPPDAKSYAKNIAKKYDLSSDMLIKDDELLHEVEDVLHRLNSKEGACVQ